jgi:hypothetical protein
MKLTPTLTRMDAAAAAALWVAVMLIFSPGAPRLGFYYDDAPVLTWLPSADLATLWSQMRGYVPGRNLHYLWQYLIYHLAGDPMQHLGRLHGIQSGLDGVAVVAFFLLLRLLSLPPPSALLAAGGFAFWPTHGETHFWPYAAPQNLVSTLFVIAFAATTWALARDVNGSWRLWTADAAAFGGALFTYDQAFVVLAGLTALRLWRVRRWTFFVAHFPYAVAGAVFVWLKLRIPAGHAPVLTSDAGRLLLENIPATLSGTVGRLWLRRVAPLYAPVTTVDWLLAALVALVLTGLALWLLREMPGGSDPWPLLALAVFCYVAAYLPIWVWHVSQRHHYLPSVALFAGGAAGLTAAWNHARPPARAVVAGLLGLGLFALAAACRGESRYWEQSFTLKRQLFADLKPDLQQADVLVLEDFPLLLGPAYFIAPQDAEYGAFLLTGRPRNQAIAGDVSSSPAPAGIFLYTLSSLHGPASFRYYATNHALVVRFTGLRDGRMDYTKNAPSAAPYQVVRSSRAPASGPFEIHRLSGRREGSDLVVSLAVRAAVTGGRSLAAVVSLITLDGHSQRWSLKNREGIPKTVPLLLSGSGNYDLEQTVRLQAVPPARSLRLEFYEVAPDRDAAPLGRAEMDGAS